jgi:hypothetical protein
MASHSRRVLLWFKGLMLSVVVFTVLLGFNNCSGFTPPSTNGLESSSLASINYLREPRPDLIKGRNGYSYILNEYLRPNCAGCHDDGSFTNLPCCSDSLSTAYFSATLISREAWIDSFTHNKFCGPDCSLDPKGEVYSAFVEWLDNSAD